MEKVDSDEIIEQSIELINDKYKVIKKIGSGSFGDVYSSIDNADKEYAIKFELIKKKNDKNRLIKEYEIYNILKYSNNFIKLFWYGEYKNYRVIVMQKIDTSLKEIFSYNNKIFNTNTICNISMQMMDILEELHNNRIIHQDIKPANILFNKNSQKIYLIDFGISSTWEESSKQEKINRYIGTARYSSIRSHNRYKQSRVDDLESFGYVLIYFANGKLPWQNISSSNIKDKWNKIRDIKETVGDKTLCKNLKRCYYIYMKYLKKLGFYDKPDYYKLKKVFEKYTKNSNIFY